MSKQSKQIQDKIHLGTHGEDYGSWMSNPVFYVMGVLIVIAAVLAFLFLKVFPVKVLGILFAVLAAVLLVFTGFLVWVRRQYAFNDSMRKSMYGDMDAFAQKLRNMGYQEVRFVDTTKDVFGSKAKASMLFLPDSRMLVGRK